MDTTNKHSDKEKGIGEGKERMDFRILVNTFHDLAKGKKEVLYAINRVASKP